MTRRILSALGVILTVTLLHAASAGASEVGTPTEQALAACSASGLVAGTADHAACVANLAATLDQARQLGS